MTTREISEHLAAAASAFPFLGTVTPEALCDLVRWELGDEKILDDFQPRATHRSMAVGPETILHIISGNTPHAGLQSLMRGLLLKSRNLCKIPSAGLPEIARFRDALPPALAARIEIATELPPDWIERANAVIVFGTDETVEKFRALTTPAQIFVAHGHRVSFGVIFDDPRRESVALAARDASLFDQQGCLSPHVFYVRECAGLDAMTYAELLAAEMEKFNAVEPRGVISSGEAAAIHAVRADYEFRVASAPGIRVWKSATSSAWTVICDRNSAFTISCLNRVIFVKPWPEDPAPALFKVKPHLSTIAIWPASAENANRVRGLGATRICSVGAMQSPPLAWHQDGLPVLASLVRWNDVET